MKDDLSALLAHETDDAIPAADERRIRDGLEALLAAAPLAAAAPSPSTAPSLATGAKTAAATLKVTTAAVLGLGLAAGGFALGRATAPATPSPERPAEATSVVAPVVAPAPIPSSVPSASAPPAPASLPSSTAVSPPAPVVSAPPSSFASAFDRESSLLERARAALVRHDAAAAESALDAFDKQFPASRHAEERDYLRIQLLRERGETAAARDRARAFLTAHPDSLFRARVEPLAR